MARILTGIQSTGTPHLGNLLGAIRPPLTSLINRKTSRSCSSPICTPDAGQGRATPWENTYAVAAAWLAFGLDTERTVFYRQSDVAEVTELAWYLNCFFLYQRPTLAHSFKDKADRLEDVNGGLFSTPC